MSVVGGPVRGRRIRELKLRVERRGTQGRLLSVQKLHLTPGGGGSWKFWRMKRRQIVPLIYEPVRWIFSALPLAEKQILLIGDDPGNAVCLIDLEIRGQDANS